jgi:hypothetical protein
MSDIKSSKDIKKSVTSKSTKDEIKTALNEALKALIELETISFDPGKEKIKKEKTEIIDGSEKMIKESDKGQKKVDKDIETTINKMENITVEFGKAYNDSIKFFDESKEQYNSVKEAIKIQEDKLKELFDIEKVLLDLSMIMNVYKEKKEELERI